MLFIDPSSHDIGRSPCSSPRAYTPSVRWGVAIEAEDFRLSPTACSSAYSFHLLGPSSPLLAGYWLLRSAIFCQEQHLFEASDRDGLDGRAHPIVAIHHGVVGGDGAVVGVVRIVETEPGLWYGGRLGVAAACRRENQIGKGLIWKAVTTAHAWGAERFLATVQIQNVPFFRRLHWQSLETLEIRGIPHHRMEADLAYYRPAPEPRPRWAQALRAA
jgi:putative N-acetyltransferase (TIGR04045 family)